MLGAAQFLEGVQMRGAGAAEEAVPGVGADAHHQIELARFVAVAHAAAQAGGVAEKGAHGVFGFFAGGDVQHDIVRQP